MARVTLVKRYKIEVFLRRSAHRASAFEQPDEAIEESILLPKL